MKTQYQISFLILFIIFSCKESETNFGSNFVVDNHLNKNELLKKLNDSLEFKLTKRDSIHSKRSTDIKLKINTNDTITNLSKLKANSSFINTYTFGKEELIAKQSDTLAINIDNFDGYSSEGIKILVYKDRFDVKFYMTSDFILPIKPIEITKVNSSKLILNKKKFKVNDSIYGFIEADLTYQNRFSLQQKIKAKGYFRTIIKENKY